MPFEIVRNDITKMQVDAIVNTANPDPVVGSGTDFAIHKAAGAKLLEARKAIGDISVGESVETSAYDLSAKYVLHTVSPYWVDGEHQEQELLRKAYDSALGLAERLQCKSVAFPLMAAGNYAFPREIAMKVAVNAFTDFLMRHEMKIYLVIFSSESFALAGSLFEGLKCYVDDNYVAECTAEEYASGYRDSRRGLASLSQRGRFGIDCQSVAVDADWLQEAHDKPTDMAGYLNMEECSLPEYIQTLLKESGMKAPEVYNRVFMSKALFSKVINNSDFVPKKSTMIKLAIAFHLDLAQTQKLLGKAGYALTHNSKSDLIVQYFIDRKVYNIIEIDTALFDYNLPTLND